MFRRKVLAVLASAALCTSLGAGAPCLAGDPAVKPPSGQVATKIQDGLKKLYGKADGFRDPTVRNDLISEVVNVVLGVKDKKANPLKATAWWSSSILENLYSNDKWAKLKAPTKDVVLDKFQTFPGGEGKPAFDVKCAIRGANTYGPKKSYPLLICVVDGKTDPKAYLEKNWASIDKFKNEWLLLCVPEADGFNLKTHPNAIIQAWARMIMAYNVDPNRVFLEASGTACTGAQHAAAAFADRLAGLVLRNPQESAVNENCGIFQTLVVRGPEGADKAQAVVANAKKVCGDAQVSELAAPDVASLEGPFQGLADWLDAAKPRSLSHEYSWTTTFDKNHGCVNPLTGSLYLKLPQKAETPTTAKVRFDREKGLVDIQSTNLSTFVLMLNDDLLDLDREVAIFVNGNEIDKRVFDRKTDQMLDFADEWFEYGRLFPVVVERTVPLVVAASEPKEGGEKKEEGPGGAGGGGDKK